MSEVKKEGEFSLKGKKPKVKNLGKKSSNEIAKVDLKKEEFEDGSQGKVIPEVTKVVIDDDKKKSKEAVENKEPGKVAEKEDDNEDDVIQVIQEITNEDDDSKIKDVAKELKEAKRDSALTGKPLPENIEKLVSFMEETGGGIEDYVRLNADYSNVSDTALLKEYYKKTKPHLDNEDIDIIMEDFSFDEDLDDERDIRKAKIALKEEVAKARGFLEQTKSKYYDEIKLRPGVTQEQQKAVDFFNRYNEEQEANKTKHEGFVSRTKELFNDDFKGFDFNVGEKKFRYAFKNPSSVAESQSDISNFIGTFLDEKGEVKDTKGYHKALFAAKNVDTIANHFYEQGKADAVKDVMAKSKNITTEPRKNNSGEISFNGFKVKAVNGIDSSRLKIRKR